MVNDKIGDQENLYRLTKKSQPKCWKNGKPMPAAFIDARGASVDRDYDRDEDQIIDKFTKRFEKRDEFGGLIKIGVVKCKEAQTCVKPLKTKSNDYHAEIHNSETEVEISLLKAKKLADFCNVVKGPYNENDLT